MKNILLIYFLDCVAHVTGIRPPEDQNGRTVCEAASSILQQVPGAQRNYRYATSIDALMQVNV